MPNVQAWISHHERMLGIVIVAALIILIFVRVVWLGEVKSDGSLDSIAILRTIVNSLISTIAVTTIVALSLRYMRPPQEVSGATSYVQSYDIGHYLRDSADTAREWIYYGHTARYVRSAIFPILADGARHGRAIRVLMLIIDPADQQLCEYYARYRNAARTAGQGPQ